jgi:hypothetical protein
MSDHGSGPRAFADPVVDITDMYVFPSPERPASLVLVLNVNPFAEPATLFSDAVDYRFRVRPLQIAKRGAEATFAVSEKEYTFSCRFAVPVEQKEDGQLVQEGTCTASTGQTVAFTINDEAGGQANGLRVFAGRRMDPFFLDGAKVGQSMMTGKLAFESVGNSTQFRQNVMSIVVELDVAEMFAASDGPLFGVVSETVRAGSITLRLERFGRPEIKNFILGLKHLDPLNRDIEIRDLYNQEDAFKLKGTYLTAYRARMNANLAAWDSLDGKTDWPLEVQGVHPLTELLLADFMVVDASKPFSDGDNYLEIERALLMGADHQTCGGRSLNEDSMDTLITFLVNAGKGPRISDGVDQQAVPASRIFPYLVPPEANPPPIPAFFVAAQNAFN